MPGMMPIVSMLMAAAPLAAAQDAPSAAEARTIAQFSRCRTIAEPAARLSCFDAAAKSFEDAVRSRELVVLDREDVKKTRRSLFGFPLPRVGRLFGAGRDDADEPPEVTELTAKVAGVRGLGYDKYAFTLEDGARWQTTEAVGRMPRAGQSVTIKKGALGNYFIRFEGARAVRGMRLN